MASILLQAWYSWNRGLCILCWGIMQHMLLDFIKAWWVICGNLFHPDFYWIIIIPVMTIIIITVTIIMFAYIILFFF